MHQQLPSLELELNKIELQMDLNIFMLNVHACHEAMASLGLGICGTHIRGSGETCPQYNICSWLIST